MFGLLFTGKINVEGNQNCFHYQLNLSQLDMAWHSGGSQNC